MSVASSEKYVVLDIRQDPPAEKPIDPNGRYRLTCDCKMPNGNPCRYKLVIKGSMVDWGKDIMRRHVRKAHNFNVGEEKQT